MHIERLSEDHIYKDGASIAVEASSSDNRRCGLLARDVQRQRFMPANVMFPGHEELIDPHCVGDDRFTDSATVSRNAH